MKLTPEYIEQHNKIPGYVSLPCLNRLNFLLESYNTPNTVGMEIGSMHGRSSWLISKTIKSGKLFCVDVWQGNDTYNPNLSVENALRWNYPPKGTVNTKEQFLSNTSDCKNIIAIHGVAPDVLADWNTPLDFIFIDAIHNNPDNKILIEFGLKWVKPGGLLCGHDYCNDWPDIVENVSMLENLFNTKVSCIEGSSVYSFKIPNS